MDFESCLNFETPVPLVNNYIFSNISNILVTYTSFKTIVNNKEAGSRSYKYYMLQ